MYAFTMNDWLNHAHLALRWEFKGLALWCLSRAMLHARQEGKTRSVGHILSAIKMAKRM